MPNYLCTVPGFYPIIARMISIISSRRVSSNYGVLRDSTSWLRSVCCWVILSLNHQWSTTLMKAITRASRINAVTQAIQHINSDIAMVIPWWRRTDCFCNNLLLSIGLPILCAWAVPYRVIDTWGKYSIVDTPMFTLAIPLSLYITFRQIIGERDKYSSLWSKYKVISGLIFTWI